MASRQEQLSEERRQARRRLLLSTATRLFGRHGYHATTVPMIVAEAASSTGSFYLYFRNKEDAFNAALLELDQEIERLLNSGKLPGATPIEEMAGKIEALFLFLADSPEQARILIVESSGLSRRLEQTRRSILLRQETHVLQLLESDPAIFPLDQPRIAAQCVVGAVFEALLSWLQEDEATRMSAVQVARAVARFTTQAVSVQSFT